MAHPGIHGHLNTPAKFIVQSLARILAWAASTADLRDAMTSSGLSAPKIAVPATMTLLPKWTLPDQARFAGANTYKGRTCLGTSIDRLRTYASIHLNVLGGKPCAEFCDLGHAALDELLPATTWKGPFQSAREKAMETTLARIHGHDEKHIGELADLVRYRCGMRVRRDCYPGLHVSLMDRVDKGDGIRCDTVSVQDP